MVRLHSFSKSEDVQIFFRTLNKRISSYFSENDISRKGNFQLYLKTAVVLGLYFAPYVVLISTPMNIWMQLSLCVITGIGMAGVGMNVMHDGNHGSYSSVGFVNKIMGGTMYLLSGNANNWNVQHNVLHHSYTNIYGYDEDLEAGHVVRFSDHADWSWFHRYQHIYSIFIYGFLTINWLLTKDFLQTISYTRKGFYGENYNNFLHWCRMLLFKLLYYSVWIVIPIIFMENPWWQILIGFFAIHYVAGFILSVIFQLAHVVEKPQTMLPNSKEVSENSWAIHQLHTTTNFGTKSRLLNWYTGGLNHQIEHHLFPGISHVHYSKIAGIVRNTAKEFSVPYYEYKTMWDAVNSHFKHLKELSKKPQPIAT